MLGLFFVIVGDCITGSGLKHFYFKTSSGLLQRTTYALEETKEDILIFGSSRANHHYDTKIIEKKSGMSAYNTGRDGNFIFFQTALLKSILKRYKPKQIILDFSGTFKYSREDYDRLSSLLPYYNTHEELRNIIHLKSPYEKFKLKSKIYPYNSLLTTIIIGNLKFNHSRFANKGEYNGFVPANGIWEKEIAAKETPRKYKIDKNKLNAFEEFLELVKKRNIPTVVVYSPVYYFYESNYTIEMVEEICKKYNITFVDYSKDVQFLKNKELFSNPTHLNNKGAKLLTQEVLQYLELHLVESENNIMCSE